MADSDARPGSGPPVDLDVLKLSDLLESGWKIFEEVDRTNEPVASTSVQESVRSGIRMLEDASRMVAQLALFSRNEDLEEVATADLKYLLLPALLGALHMKRTSREKRLEAVQAARVYYMDFLQRCRDYNVSQFEMPHKSSSSPEEVSAPGSSNATPVPAGPSDLVSMAARRQSKIERYRQRKELEAKLSEVRRVVDSGQADDEVSRDFYLLNIRRWVTLCLEEMESMDQELEILRNTDLLKQSPPSQPSRRPMKPFILTKDSVQAQVFGAGYPSLPTMTVNDWYEQHAKHGVLPDMGLPRRAAAKDSPDAEERDKEEEEKKSENDDEESLLKARNWDDWKDSHRRGYGNRQNMG
ncbi:immunoglobulin-binding protein 1 [Nothobranchius furzeri]|uniref:Immunoglobulin (CD79A) binding protein 1 n=1 Tax=Nothobranchius furzeri TaxID=105023 RepID=A0A8C6M472_NOTFU|nr:immunoglobulin (CD79A) binding protein 1 [Nothobranchius furzeri]